MSETQNAARLLNPWVFHFQKLGLELKCPLCLNLLKKPVLLPCNHIFCNFCVPTSSQFSTQCPTCHQQFSDEEIRPASYMENIVSIYKSLDATFSSAILPLLSTVSISTSVDQLRKKPSETTPKGQNDHTDVLQINCAASGIELIRCSVSEELDVNQAPEMSHGSSPSSVDDAKDAEARKSESGIGSRGTEITRVKKSLGDNLGTTTGEMDDKYACDTREPKRQKKLNYGLPDTAQRLAYSQQIVSHSDQAAVSNCIEAHESKDSTSAYYLRTCKGKRLKSIDSLPDDLLFKILLHLPTQDIYDQARLVCWKWYRIIHTHHFVYEHLQHTTYGLLFQGFVDKAVFLALRQGRIEISRYSCKFSFPVWATCNGLILQFDRHNHKAIYITNPLTKEIFDIPLFTSHILFKELCGIAYAMASMQYKVVVTHDPDGVLKGQRCAILTVGVDKSWRNVPTDHLSLEARNVFNKGPLITEGFMHWAMGGGVLTLNVETETITETPAPVPQVYTRVQMRYVSTGKYLTLLISCGQYLWQFWEMKPETGEWRKLPNISLEAQKCRMEQLGFEHSESIGPSGWLKYPEVLTFVVYGRDRTSMIFYHLLTQEIDLIDLPSFTNFHTGVVHRNSLVWSSDI